MIPLNKKIQTTFRLSVIAISFALIGCDNRTSDQTQAKATPPVLVPVTPSPSPTPEASPTPYVDRLIAKVGRFEIFLSDTFAYERIQAIFPIENHQKSALDSLITNFSWATAYEKLGHQLTDDVLEAYVSEMQKTNYGKERIEKIRALFPDNEKAFLKVFVVPMLVLKKMASEEFTKSQKNSSNAYLNAKALIDASATSPKKLESLAKKQGLIVRKLSAKEGEGIFQDGQKVASFSDLFNPASIDVVLAQPLNIKGNPAVVRIDSISKSKVYNITAVTISETKFSDWISEQTKDIPVTRLD